MCTLPNQVSIAHNLLFRVDQPTTTEPSLNSALAHATGNTIMNCARNWAENIATSRSLIRYSGWRNECIGICFLFYQLIIRALHLSSFTFRKRNILSPNEQFGTRGCYSGFEGVVNENDLFSSCHIRIFEPNLYQRHTRLFQCAAVFCVLCVIVFASCCWKYLLRREERRHRQHSMVKKISNHHASNAFAYARKKNQ